MHLSCSTPHSSSDITLSLSSLELEELLRAQIEQSRRLRVELEESKQLNATFAFNLAEAEHELHTLRRALAERASGQTSTHEAPRNVQPLFTSPSFSFRSSLQLESFAVSELDERLDPVRISGNRMSQVITPLPVQENIESHEEFMEGAYSVVGEVNLSMESRELANALSPAREQEHTPRDISSDLNPILGQGAVSSSNAGRDSGDIEVRGEPMSVLTEEPEPELRPSSIVDQSTEDPILQLELHISNIRSERDYLRASKQALSEELDTLRAERDSLIRSERRTSNRFNDIRSRHQSLQEEHLEATAYLERLWERVEHVTTSN